MPSLHEALDGGAKSRMEGNPVGIPARYAPPRTASSPHGLGNVARKVLRWGPRKMDRPLELGADIGHSKPFPNEGGARNLSKESDDGSNLVSPMAANNGDRGISRVGKESQMLYVFRSRIGPSLVLSKVLPEANGSIKGIGNLQGIIQIALRSKGIGTGK